eukprot:6735269-Pyramimonas_sp.AAC.1
MSLDAVQPSVSEHMYNIIYGTFLSFAADTSGVSLFSVGRGKRQSKGGRDERSAPLQVLGGFAEVFEGF